MSTLRIRTLDAPQGWWLPRLTRIVSFVESMGDVLAEVDRRAGAARERYPFAD
jgi:hypothetical protein